ncbi:MAG TPA: energy transducer TonB [Flavipsychrobacter sp.]|nr:energy transducer TonB [Flavipsychrobacter sp.]
MKNLLFLIFALLPFTRVAAQSGAPEIFTMIEQMPQFPGGDKALLEYLRTTIRYPKAARKEGREGKVHTKFVVNEDGSISDIVIERSAGKDLDAETLRVISAMPKWIPGKQNGRAVKVYMRLPILFRLEE